MAAANKILVFIFLFVFSVIVLTEESNHVTKQSQRLIDLSYRQMVLAFDALDNKIKKCHKSSYNNVLPASMFRTLNISPEIWRIILPYYSYTATHQCEGEALWGNAVIALNKFKFVEKYYTGKNSRKTRYKPENLCCALWESDLSLELRFLTIPSEVRKKLSLITKLNRPFDVMKAVKELESWSQ